MRPGEADAFKAKFWDGETEAFGSGVPAFTPIFNCKEAAKNVLSRGTLGFGKEYIDGNIDVEGYFQQLLCGEGRRFEANAQKVEEMYNPRTVRMWRMFLNGSSAAFRWGDIRLYQILITNGLNNSLPMTRENISTETETVSADMPEPALGAK